MHYVNKFGLKPDCSD